MGEGGKGMLQCHRHATVLVALSSVVKSFDVTVITRNETNLAEDLVCE